MAEQIVKWAIVGMMALGALLSISSVGKPKKPLTGSVAAAVALVAALEIAAIIAWWD